MRLDQEYREYIKNNIKDVLMSVYSCSNPQTFNDAFDLFEEIEEEMKDAITEYRTHNELEWEQGQGIYNYEPSI